MTIKAKNFGLAAGIIWGAVMFLSTLVSNFTGYGLEFLNIMKSIYPWYSVTIAGSFIGLIEGFIDGFIGAYLFAVVYNKLGPVNQEVDKKKKKKK